MDPRLKQLTNQLLESYRPKTTMPKVAATGRRMMTGPIRIDVLALTVDSYQAAVAEIYRSCTQIPRFELEVSVCGQRVTFGELIARAAEEHHSQNVAARVRGILRQRARMGEHADTRTVSP